MCQVSDARGAPCGKRAEVKLADAAGDKVWTCLAHADEILVTVRGQGSGVFRECPFLS